MKNTEDYAAWWAANSERILAEDELRWNMNVKRCYARAVNTNTLLQKIKDDGALRKQTL
jgi:hypothetical protein